VATLLLVTSCVVLTCIVIDYAVVIFQDSLQTTNIPQLDRIRQLQQSLLNETDSLFNQTLPEVAESFPP
jgi:hypothetical protein